MQLPTTKTPATRKSPQMLVLYGPPKVGKTTAISQLEGCLNIDIEDGSDFLEMLKIKIDSYTKLMELAGEIRKLPTRPYKYVAIDTVTRLEEWAEMKATQNYRSSILGKNFTGASILELPNGAGYMWLRTAFLEMIMLVKSLAHNTIFVAHLRDKMLAGADAKSGTMVSAKDLDLTGKCKQILCSQADAIGYLYRQSVVPNSPDTKLHISFASNELVNCGSRCDHLKGANMLLDWSKIYVD